MGMGKGNGFCANCIAVWEATQPILEKMRVPPEAAE
jgi:hypothetical protein